MSKTKTDKRCAECECDWTRLYILHFPNEMLDPLEVLICSDCLKDYGAQYVRDMGIEVVDDDGGSDWLWLGYE